MKSRSSLWRSALAAEGGSGAGHPACCGGRRRIASGLPWLGNVFRGEAVAESLGGEVQGAAWLGSRGRGGTWTKV